MSGSLHLGQILHTAFDLKKGSALGKIALRLNSAPDG
jgi:hypothetical protein